MWTRGKNKIKKWEDVNLKLSKLEGELTDEQAMVTFAEFLFANPGLTLELLANIKIFPLQEIIIKGWMKNDYSMAIWGRGLSKCIDVDSLVLTNRGIIPIKDVKIGDLVFAEKGPQRILNKWFNPEEDGFEITTKNGYSFKAKNGHKFKVYDLDSIETKFVDIESVSVGDLVPIKSGPNYFKQDEDKVEPEVYKKYYLAGRYINNDAAITKEEIKEIASLKKGIISKRYIKHIPKDLISGSREKLICLLGGIFSSRMIVKNDIVLGCLFHSDKLAKEVHNLLLVFGVVSELKIGHQNITSISISDSNSLKRFEWLIDQGKYLSGISDTPPDESQYNDQNSRFYVDNIKSITPCTVETCDITVENEECYWSNGIIHHNSFSAAVFCLFWSIFNPNNRIILISFVFRATRKILEQIFKFVNAEGAENIKSCFPTDLQKRSDEWQWALPNGSSIVCLPLGDGTKIRGFRADTLIIDEYNYMNANIITEVIQPFLVASNNVTAQMTIDRLEDKLIAMGKMTEDQRTVLDENIKVICLSSAGFQFEDMYQKYSTWVHNIMEGTTQKSNSTEEEKNEFGKGDNISYFVSRLSYEAAPKGLLNTKVIEEAKQGTSNSVFDREYRAIFTPDSDGYYSAKKMQECTVPNGQYPCLELEGEKGAEYILAIDPSFSSAEYSDYFAMVVLKIVEKGDKKIPMLVHCYAVAGGSLKDHTMYLFFLLKKFNIVYIAIDSTGGDSNEFINSSNQSALFQEGGIELLDIQADYNKYDNPNLAKEIRKSYNKQHNRIVHKQHFGSGNFLRSANEYLQGCIDRKTIMFAAKLNSNPSELAKALSCNIDMIKQHASFRNMDLQEFIEDQDNWVDVTKQECALIEMSISALGAASFDLPSSMRRSKSPNRVRKDLYSALLLGNWGFKLYMDSQSVEEIKNHNSFAPMIF